MSGIFGFGCAYVKVVIDQTARCLKEVSIKSVIQHERSYFVEFSADDS